MATLVTAADRLGSSAGKMESVTPRSQSIPREDDGSSGPDAKALQKVWYEALGRQTQAESVQHLWHVWGEERKWLHPVPVQIVFVGPSDTPLGILARLEELRELKDGWLDGAGHAPAHDGLDWLSVAFERHYVGAPLPYVYPTAEGGVQMEWSLGSREISLEVTFADHSAEWFWTDVSNDDEDERTLNLDTAAAWEWIADEIRRLADAAA